MQVYVDFYQKCHLYDSTSDKLLKKISKPERFTNYWTLDIIFYNIALL